MFSSLDRYILREMISPFLVALVVFFIFIVMELLLLMSTYSFNQNIAWDDLFRMMAYRLPELLVQALPLAVLFAVLLGLGRLNGDLELMALQTSGISLRRILYPVMLFGMVVGMLTFVFYDYVAPWTMEQFHRLQRQIIFRQGTPQVQSDTIFRDPSGRFFYVGHYNKEQETLQDIMVFDPHGRTYLASGLQSSFPQTITAESARWNLDRWILSNGTAYQFDNGDELAYKVRFEELSIHVGDIVQLFNETRRPSEMSLNELKETIDVRRKAGQPVTNLVVAFHNKIIIPVGAVIFALLTGPMTLSFGFRSRSSGIIAGLLLTVSYIGSKIMVENFSLNGILAPDIGPWIPTMTFGLLGVLLLSGVDRFNQTKFKRWVRIKTNSS